MNNDSDAQDDPKNFRSKRFLRRRWIIKQRFDAFIRIRWVDIQCVNVSKKNLIELFICRKNISV